jgi:hypothetical protein
VEGRWRFLGGNIILGQGTLENELFLRWLLVHTFRYRWLTLGNQLVRDQIYEEDLAMRIKAK